MRRLPSLLRDAEEGSSIDPQLLVRAGSSGPRAPWPPPCWPPFRWPCAGGCRWWPCCSIAIGIEALTQLMPGFDNDSFTLMVVFVLTLYSVGRHARRVEAWLAGLVVAGCVVGFLLTDSPPPYDVGDVLFTPVFVGGPGRPAWRCGCAATASGRCRRTTELQREQGSRPAAVAEERPRIARELHDVVSHAISVTVLQARGGRRMLAADPSAARRAFDVIEHTNAQALGDMRRLLAMLRESDEAVATSVADAGRGRTGDQLRSSGLAVALRSRAGGTSPRASTCRPTASSRRRSPTCSSTRVRGPGPVDSATAGGRSNIAVSDDGPGDGSRAPRDTRPRFDRDPGAGRGRRRSRSRWSRAAGGFRVRAHLPYEVP